MPADCLVKVVKRNLDDTEVEIRYDKEQPAQREIPCMVLKDNLAVKVRQDSVRKDRISMSLKPVVDRRFDGISKEAVQEDQYRQVLVSIVVLQLRDRPDEGATPMASPLVAGGGGLVASHIPTLVRDMAGEARSQPGVRLGMGGDPKPCAAVNLHPSGLSSGRRIIESVCTILGPRCKLLRLQEWTQPFHRVYGVGDHHKTTALITVLLAALAATAQPTSEFELDLRYL